MDGRGPRRPLHLPAAGGPAGIAGGIDGDAAGRVAAGIVHHAAAGIDGGTGNGIPGNGTVTADVTRDVGSASLGRRGPHIGVAGLAGATSSEWRTPGRIGRTAAAFVRRDWAIARSYRLNLALELGSILFSLGMFFFLGRLVDRSGAGREAAGATAGALPHGYFAFAAVGQAVLRVVQVGTSSSASRLRTEQTTGTLETLLTSAAPTPLVVLATGAFDLLFAVASGIVTLALAVAFGMHLGATPASAAAVLLVGLPGMVALFAALGVAVAAFVLVFKQGAALVGLTTSALALLCGVFFPVGTLPRPLGSLAELLPLTWVLDVLRAGLLDGRTDWAHLGLLLASAALLLPASLVLFGAAARVARRRGTLAQY